MMNLAISHCTELERDFLIRYMNAAKSKSTVVIEKHAANALIGFYVNPKAARPAPRNEGETEEEIAEEEECVDDYSEVCK